MKLEKIMGDEVKLPDLLRAGAVINDVKGNTLDEVFADIETRLELPAGYDKKLVVSELLAREKILSTAVGNGIAIPHTRKSILNSEADQRLIVCYLANSLDMDAPDGLKVSVFFILLTKSTQVHSCALSDLARLVGNGTFRHFLDTRPDLDSLLSKMREYDL
jgi:PTS system nitrogen regulatory IIA component